MDDRSTLLFLGFQVKVPWRPDESWDPEGKASVVEVCSMSDCLSRRPPHWIERWEHNRAWCHSTPEQALATVPPSATERYDLFAYWLAPRTFIESQWRDFGLDDLFHPNLPPLPEGPGPTDWDVLGFDVVTWSEAGRTFDHSPLSCNLFAQQTPVNRHCLVDDLERALSLVARLDNERCEPGPYFATLFARRGAAR